MTESQEKRSLLLESWLEFNDIIAEHPEVRRLLFDPVTGPPTTPLLFPRIESLLEDRGEVSLLCLNIVKYCKIEEIYGWKVFDDVMRRRGRLARAHHRRRAARLGHRRRAHDLRQRVRGRCSRRPAPPSTWTTRRSSGSPSAWSCSCARISPRCSTRPLFPKFGCYVGAATAYRDPNTRLERLVHKALDDGARRV